jgi:endonuclease YncB( thermonuclease family)
LTGNLLTEKALIVLAVLLLAMAEAPARAAETAEPPVWTEKPVRVDRTEQDYERLDARPAPVQAEAAADPYTLRFNGRSRYAIIDSVSFAAEGKRYRLAGLEPVPSTKVCRNADGLRWACGLRARAALDALLAGRQIRCAPQGEAGGFLMVECLRYDKDIGRQQVLAGHALDGAGNRYDEDFVAAREELAGIWADVADDSATVSEAP